MYSWDHWLQCLHSVQFILLRLTRGQRAYCCFLCDPQTLCQLSWESSGGLVLTREIPVAQLILIWRWVCGNVIIAVQMSQWDLIIISWVISHVVICPETAACLSPKCILSVRVWPYMEVNSTDTILVLVNVCHHYYKFCGRRGYWHSQPPWSRAQPSMSPGIKPTDVLHWEGRGWARDYHHLQAINHWIVLTHTHVHTL